MRPGKINDIVNHLTEYQIDNVEIFDTGQHNITVRADLNDRAVYIKLGRIKAITPGMDHRFAQTIEAINYLKNTSVRVPDILYSDLSELTYKNTTYYGIIILEVIEGKPLDTIWDKQDNTRTLIVDNYANALKQVHEVSVRGFGKFSLNGTKLWNEWFISQVTYHKNIVKNHDLIDNKLLDSVYNAILDNPFLWNYEKDPKLVHNDLWRGNIIIDEDYSIGIVDWEFSIGADPIFDLQWIESDIFRDEVGLIDKFYRAYGISDLTKVRSKQVCYSVYHILRKGTEIIKYDFPDDIKQVEKFLKESSMMLQKYIT